MPATEGRSPAESFRRFSAGIAATSPLQARIAHAVSASPEAVRALGTAPARRRTPTAILAAVHDLALAGRAPVLAAAYAAGDGDAAAAAAVDVLLEATVEILAIAARLPVRADEAGRAAVLYPAIAHAARLLDARAIALIDFRCSAGLNLTVDRVGVRYGNGQALGDLSSPVQHAASVAGDRPIPGTAIPAVVAKIGVDLDPFDVTDADDARWLRACLRPDQAARAARLDAELALAAAEPPVLLRGDPTEVLPDALSRVPAGVLPVVVSTWTMSRIRRDERADVLRHLDAAAAGRAAVWVSVEGVGVMPSTPTLGDRPASGHSLVGLTVFGRSRRTAATIARCWSRGRVLAWLAAS